MRTDEGVWVVLSRVVARHSVVWPGIEPVLHDITLLPAIRYFQLVAGEPIAWLSNT